MACDTYARLLPGYVDSELDLARTLDFEDHLTGCASCTQDLDSQLALRKAVRSANLYERAPQGLEGRIRASLPSPANKVTTIAHRTEWGWVAVAAAIILAVLLAWRVTPNMRGGSNSNLLAQEIVDSHIRSLQQNHLMDVISTDQHTVKPWFDGKLDFSPPVKDLATQGFPLIGGRMDYIGHRGVAVLVYQRRKHLINVYVWPSDTTAETAPQASSIQGYNMIEWRHGGMNFWAVSDVNLDDLRQFTQLLEE